MLFIPVFAKTDTRNTVCRPTLLPAAMAHSGALSPVPSRLGLASSHNSSQPWGVWEWGLPVRICYCAGSDLLILDTKPKPLVRRMKANYNHGQKSWNTFEFLERFPSHAYPAPPLIPQTTLDACFQNHFAPVSTLCRAGRGERTTRKFRKGCTLLW